MAGFPPAPGLPGDRTERFGPGLVYGGQARPTDPAYVQELVRYFCGLCASSRGDSARGRGLGVLHLLNLVWSGASGPLAAYRPYRKPAAFVAMTADLFWDSLFGHSERAADGDLEGLSASLRVCLELPWRELSGALRGAGLVRFAAVLDELVRSALLNPLQSGVPAELRQLERYLSAAQLSRFRPDALLGALPLHTVLAALRFRPPDAARREQHPVGGDLRRAIREGYDGRWCAALRDLEPTALHLLAALPIDLSLLGPGALDEDFAVVYANLTDARSPGRVWGVPAAYLGGSAEAHARFAYLTESAGEDRLLRRAHVLAHVGLSSTFPETVARFDALLRRSERFPELHAGRAWQALLTDHAAAFRDARRQFLARLGHDRRPS